MRSDWVAAAVRARAMARRRVGAGACRRIAERSSLTAALPELDGTGFAERVLGCTALEEAQRAASETVLWEMRVLAGWLPAGGTRLLRALAAGFELENIRGLAARLDGAPERPAYALGALATAWPRLSATDSPAELHEALGRSAWGDPGDGGSAALADALRVSWLRALASAAPEAKPWAARAAALTAARLVLVDAERPSERLQRLARPLIGEGWVQARDCGALREALPVSVRGVLDGIEEPTRLWRAEARAVASVEEDAFALLRTALPGPPVVLGAVVVLAVDCWRLRAALASAEAGGGGSEVLDAVA